MEARTAGTGHGTFLYRTLGAHHEMIFPPDPYGLAYSVAALRAS